MPFGAKMMKVEHYPLIHQMHLNFQLSADDASRTASGTIIPIITSDEAQVASAKSTNPRNSAFAPMNHGHCCPQSNVNRVSGSIVLDMTKFARETDKINNLKVMIMPIAVAFEDIEAIDEKTTTSVKAILELQSESTTRNVYPIYNNDVLIGTKIDMGASQLGLTATTALEGITFDQQQLYDALTFFTNKGKLAACIGKIRYVTVKKFPGASSGTINFNINLPKKVQHMNPYTFFGMLIYIPQLGAESQFGIAADTAPGEHVHVDVRLQFLEWNSNFVMDGFS